MSKKLLFKPGQGTGDDGKTDLLQGRRVSKTHPVIKLNALIDELNSSLGMMKTFLSDKKICLSENACAEMCRRNYKEENTGKNRTVTGLEAGIAEIIEEIQKCLIKLSAKNAGQENDLSPEFRLIEKFSSIIDQKVKPPRQFIIPGTDRAEAYAHIARTKTRLCEIAAWEAELLETAKFLNSLSDLMFLIALYLRRED